MSTQPFRLLDLVPSWLRQDEEHKTEERTRAVYDKTSNVPLPICRMAVEFAGLVCANARPFDDQPHLAQSLWASCDICGAMLCSEACGLEGCHRHHVCHACRSAHENARCMLCRALVLSCLVCVDHVRCERRGLLLPLCSCCRRSVRLARRVQTCNVCQKIICSCCVALHMGHHHPSRKRKPQQ
jgi:hypothetical protein